MIWLLALAYADEDALVVDGETVELSGEHHFSVVEVVNGGLLAITPYDGVDEETGWLRIVAWSVTVDATSSIDGVGAGYPGGLGGNGSGPGGGTGWAGDTYASGGGYGGRGDKGYYGCYSATGAGGATYGTTDGLDLEAGSGGGGGSSRGGDGGGALRIDAAVVDLAGSVDMSGTSGTDGAGGGSGGGVLLYVDSGSVTGSLVVSGGRGSGSGGYSGGGGGGGGGRLKLFHGGLDLEQLTTDISGGDGPCNYHEPHPGTSYTDEVDTDRDGDGVLWVDGDCDDWDAAVFPGQVESANGVDDDCDGQIDEEDIADEDEDGDGWTVEAGDCDDSDPERHPEAEELDDGVDNDCDGAVDEGFVTPPVDSGTDSGSGDTDSAEPEDEGETEAEGCGCAGTVAPGWLLPLALLLRRRRV